MSLSIILPTINERDNLKTLIPQLYSIFHGVIEAEIIVVDDGSTDETHALMFEFCRIFPSLVFIERQEPDGLPGAIFSGVSAAQGDLVAWLDADGSMPAQILYEMYLEFSASNLEVIIGSRFVTNGGFKGLNEHGRTSLFQFLQNLKASEDSAAAVILSRILNFFLRVILNAGIKDVTSGFILTHKSLVINEKFVGKYGEYFPVLIKAMSKRNLRIKEYGYVCLPRAFGVSKTGNSLSEYIKKGFPYVYFSLKLFFDDVILSLRCSRRLKMRKSKAKRFP
jgi:glycosyltransferase involved in cell wall biosynthesis